MEDGVNLSSQECWAGDQRHLFGYYGPFIRTWCWLTEGRSLQHYPELLQFYYNIHEFLQLLKDNKLSSSVFSPAVKVGGSCQEKWYYIILT